MDERPELVARQLGSPGELPVQQADRTKQQAHQSQPGHGARCGVGDLIGGQQVVTDQGQTAKARPPQNQAMRLQAQATLPGAQHGVDAVELL